MFSLLLAGPTCRCQEAMRYYSTSSPPQQDLASTDWFIFQDDDLYVQPFAFLSLLSHFNAKEEAIAIVSGVKSSFRHMKAFPECSKQFPMAMPGILSRLLYL